LLIQRLGENDKIVTRYVADQDFQNAAFDRLADEIFDSVVAAHFLKSDARSSFKTLTLPRYVVSALKSHFRNGPAMAS